MKPKPRMVPTYYWDSLKNYLLVEKLATEDEVHDFGAFVLHAYGAAFRPYVIDAAPCEPCHKVERLLIEHFITPQQQVFTVLPYLGGFEDDLPSEGEER